MLLPGLPGQYDGMDEVEDDDIQKRVPVPITFIGEGLKASYLSTKKK